MSSLKKLYQGIFPDIAKDGFIAPNAAVIGKVKTGPRSTTFFNTVLGGDVEAIFVGERSNLQDGIIVHVAGEKHETHIGYNVSIGHNALIHDAILGDSCFIGMSATIMGNVYC